MPTVELPYLRALMCRRVRECSHRRVASGAFLPLLFGSILGCSPAYIARAGYEQARILWSREPIERVLNEPLLDADTRQKLELVVDVRRFAADDLGLRVAGNYASIARVGDGAIMHVVTAAERFRLRPYTWWFPIVGRVPYKGYFDAEAARAEARALEQQNFDTRVVSAAAFSTLGWFDDPLLSNLLHLDAPALANLILHELLHSTHYTPGHAAFSESFANFVGYRGAAEFFAGRERAETAAVIEAEWDAAIEFSAFLASEIAALEVAYAAGLTLDEREERFSTMRAAWEAHPSRPHYRGFGPHAINNATLLHLQVYHHKLERFDALWESRGRDLRATIQAVVAATNRREDPFETLDRLLNAK